MSRGTSSTLRTLLQILLFCLQSVSSSDESEEDDDALLAQALLMSMCVPETASQRSQAVDDPGETDSTHIGKSRDCKYGKLYQPATVDDPGETDSTLIAKSHDCTYGKVYQPATSFQVSLMMNDEAYVP